MEGNTNKYQRDFYGWGQLPFRNKAVPDLWEHKNDLGDGAGGLQYMLHMLIAAYGPRLLIEGLSLSGTAANPIVAAGYAMINGKVCQLKVADTIACPSGSFVYLDFVSGHSEGDGEGELIVASYATIATCQGFPIVYNLSDVQTDIRPFITFLSAQFLQNITIRGTLNIKGAATVEGAVILSSTLNVSGVITDKSGNPVYGDPIGTIKMFDGTGWVDNSTIPGWYAMITANVGFGCTNMVDKFVMGKVVAGSGSSGGSNTNNHTHNVIRSGSTLISVSQQPTFTTPAHYHLVYGQTSSGDFAINNGIITSSSTSHVHYTQRGYNTGAQNPYAHYAQTYSATDIPTDYKVVTHTHYCNFNTGQGLGIGTSGDATITNTRTADVTLSNPAVTSETPSDTENRPAYYSMIFIRRCV